MVERKRQPLGITTSDKTCQYLTELQDHFDMSTSAVIQMCVREKAERMGLAPKMPGQLPSEGE